MISFDHKVPPDIIKAVHDAVFAAFALGTTHHVANPIDTAKKGVEILDDCLRKIALELECYDQRKD